MDRELRIWPEKIEQLRDKLGLSGYAALARELGISAQKLADARKGRQELASEVKAAIVGALEEPVSRQTYAAIFPKQARRENAGAIERVFDPEAGERLSADFWVRRLDELRERLGDVPDSAIARALKISPNTITAARRGAGDLSPSAKLKILDTLGYAASRDLLLNLLPRKAAKKLRDYDNLRFEARGQGEGE